MRATVLAADPQDDNPRRWQEGLAAAGWDATLVHGCPADLPPADLVVAHVLIGDHPTRHPVWSAALRYELRGTPLVNPTACLAACADKWLTHLLWREAGLPQPRTWRLDELAGWPEVPVLVKPAFGESARGIAVVADRAAAEAAAGPPGSQALLQEVVACRSVLRVHATVDEVLGAHARPAAAIAGLPAPDPVEREVPVGDELAAVATAAVAAVGGGVVGLDVIETPDGPVLLEANPTFSMPGHLPRLETAIVAAAAERLTSGVWRVGVRASP